MRHQTADPGVSRITPIFDLDGTLLDSDAALVAAFLALGVAPGDITYGHVLADECRRLGIALETYLATYDVAAASPFPGVADLLRQIDRWGMCSNKHVRSGHAELARLGWRPDAAVFSGDVGRQKRLEPVLAALAVAPGDAIFVGDTDHDRACAEAAGVPFALAAWNPRAATVRCDAFLARPSDLLEILG